MIREYEFDKKVTEDQARDIIAEGNELKGCKNVEINNEGKDLLVATETEDDYGYVMERLVNIVARITGGDTFEFTRFVYDD